jgi:hypothetical protein
VIHHDLRPVPQLIERARDVRRFGDVALDELGSGWQRGFDGFTRRRIEIVQSHYRCG